MKRLLLKAPGFLGDEVVFTGVVRELKLQTGWDISVKTGRPDLWLANSRVAGVNPEESDIESLEQDYCPSFHKAHQTPVHFLEQYLRDMREVLKLEGNYRISKFAGDVQPTREEMVAPPLELPSRYWIVVAGWKGGMPIKAWPIAYYQEVVDSLRGRIPFVQVGIRSSWHPPLRGVINLVGKTPLRQLISLIYHAEGVLCPITSIMHLAAAIPASTKSGFKMRPCVVVGGGREAPHYITYPMHRVMNVVGQLSCCALGGCGKSRFGPGQCPYPTPEKGDLVPKCMTLIKPAEVAAAIEFYYKGDVSLPRRLGKVDALLRRLQRYGTPGSVLNGAKIGISRGEVSAQLLRGDDRMHLVMVHSLGRNASSLQTKPKHYFNQIMAAAIQATDFARSRRRIIVAPSAEASSYIDEQSLDFVFIEHSHERENYRQELERWTRKLKAGGILAGYGYDLGSGSPNGVKKAVEEFALSRGMRVERDKDHTWFITLPAIETDSTCRPFKGSVA